MYTLQANRLTAQASKNTSAADTSLLFENFGHDTVGLSSWDGRWEQIASRDPWIA